MKVSSPHLFSIVQDRRIFVAGCAAWLAGCASPDWDSVKLSDTVDVARSDPRYTELDDHGQHIPALDLSEIDRSNLRATTAYPTYYRPGTLVVDISARRLFHILGNNQATRYSVGVGREHALNFRGSAVIGRKEMWPSWTPTAEMIERIPKYAAYSGGMPGGIENPLGARALYLYRDGQDTHFRIHGTNEPYSIGTAVSSGCIRLLNHDIIDLYARVALGTPIVVLPGSAVPSS